MHAAHAIDDDPRDPELDTWLDARLVAAVTYQDSEAYVAESYDAEEMTP